MAPCLYRCSDIANASAVSYWSRLVLDDGRRWYLTSRSCEGCRGRRLQSSRQTPSITPSLPSSLFHCRLKTFPTNPNPSHRSLFSASSRYDTRCYFNVRSKADISQLNLPHGTDNYKSVETEKLKSKKTDMLRSKVNSLGNPYSETWKRKRKGWGREDMIDSTDSLGCLSLLLSIHVFIHYFFHFIFWFRAVD